MRSNSSRLVPALLEHMLLRNIARASPQCVGCPDSEYIARYRFVTTDPILGGLLFSSCSSAAASHSSFQLLKSGSSSIYGQSPARTPSLYAKAPSVGTPFILSIALSLCVQYSTARRPCQDYVSNLSEMSTIAAL